jgi:hypothetical protein
MMLFIDKNANYLIAFINIFPFQFWVVSKEILSMTKISNIDNLP